MPDQEQPERDLEKLDLAPELERLNTEEGSYLPKTIVDRQAELARMSAVGLAREMADMTIAAALRGVGNTPMKVLRELLDNYKISDEDWRERVGPELRRVLRVRGIEISERGSVTVAPTSDGVPVTEQVVEDAAAEAERGYDLERIDPEAELPE